MTVLAVDPGPEESAWVLWDGARIIASGKNANFDIVIVLHEGRHDLSHVAIEMISSYGMPVGREVFTTCVWIGRLVEAVCREYGIDPFLIPRGDVKLHLCHSMRAKDSNIRQALIDRFGKPGTRKNPGLTYGLSGDTWSAFALAVTWYDKHGQKAEAV